MASLKWLSKVGAAIAKGLQYVGPLAGIVQLTPSKKDDQVVAVVQGEMEQLAGVIVTIEAAGQVIGAGGPQKLQMAAPLIANAITRSSLMVGKNIANEGLFIQGSTKIADGLADVLNALDDAAAPQS